jgi:hypothetical protein
MLNLLGIKYSCFHSDGMSLMKKSWSMKRGLCFTDFLS